MKVEIRLENDNDGWRFCYIGSGDITELAKELDFDFEAGVFQNLFGTYPIEQAIEMFQIWETNCVYYAMVLEVFDKISKHRSIKKPREKIYL